jgi:hypothetical protein
VEQDDAKQVSIPKEHDKPRHQLDLSLMLWPAVAVVVYVLSVGPAAKLYQVFELEKKHPGCARALELCYKPLDRLVHTSTKTESLYVWYATKIWRVRSPQ